LRILFSYTDWKGYSGGPLVNAVRLLPKLAQIGHEVHALVRYKGSPSTREFMESNDVIFHSYKAHTYSEEELIDILKIVEKVQPDIYVPNINTTGCFASYWLHQSGIPTINAHRSDDALNWNKALYFSDKQNRFHTSVCVCVSDWLKTELSSRVKYPIPMSVIPSGVPLTNHKSSFNSKKRSIVYSGRFEDKQKNVSEILEIFIQLIQDNVIQSAALIGSGSLNKALIARIGQTNLHSKIKIIKKLDGDEYKKELAKHQFFLLNSTYEGTPGSLMDAMSCGLIPIAKRYNGISNLVAHGETGMIFDNKNEISQFINLITMDSEFKKLSLSAINCVEKNYSIENTAKLWDELFTSLKTRVKSSRFVIPSSISLPKFLPKLTEFNPRLSQFERGVNKLRLALKKWLD